MKAHRLCASELLNPRPNPPRVPPPRAPPLLAVRTQNTPGHSIGEPGRPRLRKSKPWIPAHAASRAAASRAAAAGRKNVTHALALHNELGCRRLRCAGRALDAPAFASGLSTPAQAASRAAASRCAPRLCRRSRQRPPDPSRTAKGASSRAGVRRRRAMPGRRPGASRLSAASQKPSTASAPRSRAVAVAHVGLVQKPSSAKWSNELSSRG